MENGMPGAHLARYVLEQLRSLLIATAVIMAMATPLRAQVDNGSVAGVVHDASGAVIAGATVVVSNLATGVATTVKTNGDGSYQVLALIPGRYSVEAKAQGFAPAKNPSSEVHVQSRIQVDFALVVGSTQEQVQVTDSDVQLQTESADVGSVIGTSQINDLPLNARRYADLALLLPGVFKDPSVANAAPDRFSSNGNLETQNYFALDGVDNNSGSTNLQEGSVQNVQPPPDAIQEFRLQTRTYSTEFGTSAGAVVNASVKSGTNHFHGDVWEYARNSALDSNTYFNRQKGIAKGNFSQNQFGATLGGPIRRDHTFFFGDYQGLRSTTATTKSSVVPSARMKTGDFSELNPSAYPLNSIATGQAGCITTATMKIAANCLDPTAVKMIALFPDPNDPHVPTWTGSPNYNFVYAIPTQINSFDARVDETINNRNQVFGRYSLLRQHRQDPPWTSNLIAGNGGFATDYNIHNQGLALGWTFTLSSSSVNEARFGFSRDYAHSDPIGLTLGQSAAATYGLSGIPASPYTVGLPPTVIASMVTLGVDRYRPQFQVPQVWQFIDTFNYLKGKHSLMFGYEYHRDTNLFLDLQAPQGYIGTSGIYTQKQGFGMADFLLGDVSTAIYNTALVVHQLLPGHSFYGQDTWRLAHNLTLNYGARYELYAPLLNRTNAIANFSPANGGTLVVASPSAGDWASRSLIQPDKNNIAPRVAFSYQPVQRVSLRGGYGVFFQYVNRVGSEAALAQNQPFLKAAFVAQSAGSVTPVFLLKNGFPGAAYAAAPVPLTAQKTNWQDPNQRTSYVQQASFGPQIQLSPTTVLELDWIGNFGHKMNRLRNANQGVVTGFASPTKAIVQFPYANLNTTTTSIAGTGTHAFLEYATNDGNTSYNAFEMSLRRQVSAGLGYQISYTYSHNFSDYEDNLTGPALPQNAYDYAHERSNSPFDQTHRLVGSGEWKLPVGQGGLVLNGNSTASKLLGDWQLNTIATLQTGNPFTVTAADNSQTGSVHPAYANCTGNPFAGTTSNRSQISNPNGTGIFISPSGFSEPAIGTFGSCRPRMFHGPGSQNVDLSLFKQFPLKEAYKIELRFEAFNAFNHADFANPAAALTNAAIFGKVTSTVNNPRQIQMAAKFYF